MFTTEVQEDRSFGGWVTQLLLATLLPLLLAMIVESKAESLGWDHPLGWIGLNAWYAALVWSIAFCLALLVHRAFPSCPA
jgi:hypothetical protein